MPDIIGFKAQLSPKKGSELWIFTAFIISKAIEVPAQLSFKSPPSAAFVGSGVCPDGCSEVPGRCDNGVLCDTDHPCSTGDCVGVGCDGYVSCRGFNDVLCARYSGDGCSLSSCGSYIDKNACDSHGCTWTCSNVPQQEICSNGFDDDGDGAFDCDDSDCWGPDGDKHWSDADVSSGRYSCLGTNMTGDKLGLLHYCADNLDPRVGLCCPTGQKLDYQLGVWSCIGSEACLKSNSNPLASCDYSYSLGNFSFWRQDDDCLNVSEPSACCEVVMFGQEKYYSDVGNVKVY